MPLFVQQPSSSGIFSKGGTLETKTETHGTYMFVCAGIFMVYQVWCLRALNISMLL